MNTQKHDNAEALERLVKAAARHLQVSVDAVPISEFFNPLTSPQRITLMVPRTVREFDVALLRNVERIVDDPIEVRFPPGESVSVPQLFDRAIHAIICTECREPGVPVVCFKTGEPHAGVVSGGLAPSLQNRSAHVARTMHPGLNAEANPPRSGASHLVED